NDDQQFSYCAKLVMGLAQLRASVMQADTFQLAVWDGQPTAAIAGTGAHCAEWAELGGQSRVISVPRDRPQLGIAEVNQVQGKPSWQLCSMLFADFAGFSLLDEDHLAQFLEGGMGRIARALERHSAVVPCGNSWGDAIFAGIKTPAMAAEIALEIQAELDPATLRSIGLPPYGGLGHSLHPG